MTVTDERDLSSADRAVRRAVARDRAITIALRAGLLVAALVVWQLVGDDSTRLALPTPSRAMSSLADLVSNGGLLGALATSNVALVLGYLLALVVGIPLGAGMGSLRWFGELARPYLVVLIAMPMIAMLPIIQVIFGIGLTSRVIVVFVFAFIYIALNTEVGVRSAAAELDEMGRSFGASRLERFVGIVLPQAFPAIMAGARLALGRAIAGMVLAEIFLVSDGVGSMLAYHRTRLDSGAVFAIIACLVLEGIVIMAAARTLERRVARTEGRR